ncbi:MAG: hypothetical protein WBG71_09980 [Leeuwenhoekiella sp.]
MMKRIGTGILGLLSLLAIIGCKNDDDNAFIGPTVRDRGEVQVENDAELQTFLQTHFYNYEEFENPDPDFDYQISFGSLEGDFASKTPLIDQVREVSFNLLETDYTLYVLNVRQGAGTESSFADSTLVNYTGFRINNDKLVANPFDFSTSPVWFDQGLNIFGFANGIAGFQGASGVSQNSDGTLSFANDFGVGAVFIPSGLAYFNSLAIGSAYANSIFTFRLYDAIPNTDSDGDGIPNFMEDLNNNFTLRDDNTDGDFVSQNQPRSNFIDSDDDGDGQPTRNEIEIDEAGNITFPDADNDGVPDYLDGDS